MVRGGSKRPVTRRARRDRKVAKVTKAVSFKGDAKYNPPRRLARYRRPIAVVPTCFAHGQTMGDFGRMLKNPTIRRFSVCMFNDNVKQWEFAGWWPKTPQAAGGGNAIARPYECTGDAIGMPTGPFGALDEVHAVGFADEMKGTTHVAREIIDEAFKRVVRLFLDRPEKDTLYFSANAPGSTTIGLGIFAGAVGDDVVRYISEKIQEIPAAVTAARRSGVRP